MPKGLKKKKNSKSNQQNITKPMVYADIDGQVYGYITKVLGNCFFMVKCSDVKERRCKVRSKKLRVILNDILIICLRSFDELNGDIIYKYNKDEIALLKKEKLIPEQFDGENTNILNKGNIDMNDEVSVFDFDDI